MTPAIDMLMQEHRAIERVLGALERCARAIQDGRAVDRAVIGDFADFFANFADKCHHAKEEDRLFATMVEHGFPRDAGPIGMMLFEHTEGRQHVGALRLVGGGAGPLTADERKDVVEHALAYVPLLQEHIMKEDEILYPMAERELPEQEFHRMMQEFEQFEAEVTGPDGHKRYRELAAGLVARFPA